ncbi:MAG: hypothetical protein KZQ72_13550 [Candidatus Thiodiazotropha sp. (ex Cardiolucina cf. quadrata)]|nr:hypothetical protein [Candidatus Thiodiazotropha sp. (ex Cardiolucina cf. quadrata)]
MPPLELANKYMEIFYSGTSLDTLKELFSDQFKFKGPFFEFNTADEYISSLKSSPPDHFKYEIIESYQNDGSACLIYNFSKPGVTTIMTQSFKVTDNKISEILLVFDTKAFT